MSYENFKPTVWSKYIQTQLPKFTVFKNDCDYKFEGEAKRGEKIKILGVNRPSIMSYIPGEDIEVPEEIGNTSVFLEMNQYDYFNYGVEDIDKAQSIEGLMEALSKEATRALAEKEDQYIAEQIRNQAIYRIGPTIIKTPEEAKTAIDELFVKLWDNGVSSKDDLCLYLPPWLYDLFEQKIVELKTDNNKQLENGLVGMYRGAKVKMTNNLSRNIDGDGIILKTSKAFAYCNSIDEVKAYCPEKRFMDAVKGLNVYGGKLVRPHECVVMIARNTEEEF